MLLVTDAAATCQAFTLQAAGETSCLPEAQAIAGLLERRPADLIVLAASQSAGEEIRQSLDGHQNLVVLEASGEASGSVRLALETGDAARLLRALAGALCQTAPPARRTEPVLPPPNGGSKGPEPALADTTVAELAEAEYLTEQQTTAPEADLVLQAPPEPASVAQVIEPEPGGHSAATLEMEDRLERVLNRRLRL